MGTIFAFLVTITLPKRGPLLKIVPCLMERQIVSGRVASPESVPIYLIGSHANAALICTHYYYGNLIILMLCIMSSGYFWIKVSRGVERIFQAQRIARHGANISGSKNHETQSVSCDTLIQKYPLNVMQCIR